MCLQLPQEFFIILNYFHYLSLFLILRIETFKYTSNHQIFDIKSRTSLMYDGSVSICSVHSEIRESDMCKFENSGVTKKFSTKESPKMIKECWTKVLMVEIKRKRFNSWATGPVKSRSILEYYFAYSYLRFCTCYVD